MSGLFNKPASGAPNVPATSGRPSSLTALTSAGKAVAAPTAKTQQVAAPINTSINGGSSLGSLMAAKKQADEYRGRPFLVHFILDVTASRADTRSAMQRYENEIAKLVMACGGKHPVLCKGTYFRGNSCSSPTVLADVKAIKQFFDTSPQGGTTNIREAITHYKDDKTDAVLSLAIFIGDSDDGDSEDSLIRLAKSLNNDKTARPVVIAHEYTGDRHFCETVAPKVAKASGGFAFGLSENPIELIALLESYKKILNATPEELKTAVNTAASGGNSDIFSRLSPQGREFMLGQARKISVPLLGHG